MKTQVKFKLKSLLLRLELQTDEDYTWADVAREADLHYNTVYNIGLNRTSRVDLKTLAKLCDFFRAKGMSVDVSDLLTFQVIESTMEDRPPWYEMSDDELAAVTARFAEENRELAEVGTDEWARALETIDEEETRHAER